MALIDRINNRIIELEKAEDEHRDHNRIGYANQTKMIRWELQKILQDECDGGTFEREQANEILPLVSKNEVAVCEYAKNAQGDKVAKSCNECTLCND